ncbi:MAG: hypothetical protein M4579_007599, partial [Chaenotheca gracillima]
PPRLPCAIYPPAHARFRDPSTGLPYANARAYAEIQSLKRGGAVWSSLLGCYVGSSTIVARGVPERFSSRENPAPVVKQEKEEHTVNGDGDRRVDEGAVNGNGHEHTGGREREGRGRR